MTTYTYTEARQQLATLLDQTRREGGVRIRRRDGSTFLLTFEPKLGSLPDIGGVKSDLTAEEIVQLVREGRERNDSTTAPTVHRTGISGDIVEPLDPESQ